MAQIGETRRAIETPFMNDYWRVRKEIGQPEDRQEYWDEVNQKLTDLSERYGNDEYVDCVLLACVYDLGKRSSYESRGNMHDEDLTLTFLNKLRKKQGLKPLTEVTT